MLAALLVSLALAASALFTADEPLQFELAAPFGDLLTHNRDDAYAVSGTLTIPVDGKAVHIDGVTIALRGHTSLREDECQFPKLKVNLPAGADALVPAFAGLHAIKIGTHCGETPDGKLTPKYGRLANEHSPLREAFVYRLLATLEIPTLAARRARITYRETAASATPQKEPLVRNAILIEDDDAAVKRVGGQREIGEAAFTSAKVQLATTDTVRLAFAEAMIGNFDWCLKMAPDDRYRCDARHPLWNIIAAERGTGPALPLIYDFDVAGIVTGAHPWFTDVFSRTFAPSASESEIEVIAQLQRVRSLFARRDLDKARAWFTARKAKALDTIAAAGLDPDGATIARRYLDAFFTEIESDQLFYRAVVTAPQAQADANADGQPACGRRSVVPAGTPVSEPLQRTGGRVQVVLLDALWHWTGADACDAIRQGPVWIDSGAIGTDFPAR